MVRAPGSDPDASAAQGDVHSGACDVDDMAENLFRALEMPLKERRQRQEALLDRIRRQDSRAWLDGFLAALESAQASEAAA